MFSWAQRRCLCYHETTFLSSLFMGVIIMSNTKNLEIKLDLVITYKIKWALHLVPFKPQRVVINETGLVY